MSNNTDNEATTKLIIEAHSEISQTCKTELFWGNNQQQGFEDVSGLCISCNIPLVKQLQRC